MTTTTTTLHKSDKILMFWSYIESFSIDPRLRFPSHLNTEPKLLTTTCVAAVSKPDYVQDCGIILR